MFSKWIYNPCSIAIQWTWDKGLSVAKINYYGNQSALLIREIDTVDDADINSIELLSESLLFCSAIVY